MVIDNANEISSEVIPVKEALHSLNSLEIRLCSGWLHWKFVSRRARHLSTNIGKKASNDEFLQTCFANSLTWAEKEPSLECDQAFIPYPAERISFAAFQPFTSNNQIDLHVAVFPTGSPAQSEKLKLQQQKLRAMDHLKDTLQRLDNSLELVNENISMVAAKL
uniref:Uncharacterized protein n=1 Tax=Populus trichocarpa TaxID=3694 RepID=B9IQE6_POPTR